MSLKIVARVVKQAPGTFHSKLAVACHLALLVPQISSCSFSLSLKPSFFQSSANMDRKDVTNLLPLRKASFLEPDNRVSMSPTVGDVAQTPEPKSTSNFTSILKSLTGNKSLRSPNPQSPGSITQHISGANALQPAIYGGPPNYEHLYEQLKVGNLLTDRIAAAESLRVAVQDFPLSDVCIVSA